MLLSKIRLHAKHLSDLGNYYATIKTPCEGAVVRTLTMSPESLAYGFQVCRAGHECRMMEDSLTVSWEEFGRMLMTYAGSNFKMEIFDPSEMR